MQGRRIGGLVATEVIVVEGELVECWVIVEGVLAVGTAVVEALHWMGSSGTSRQVPLTFLQTAM